MEASQSLASAINAVIGRQKFDVILVWKSGDRQAFSDAIVHHIDGWILVVEHNGDDWQRTTTHAFRGDEVKSYVVRPRGT